MFIGHFAPALAAAASSKRSPGLGTLFFASQLVDWAFFILLAVGIEHMRFSPGISVMNPMDLYHLPYTHSLAGSVLWAGAFGALIWRLGRDALAASIAAAVVLSHWLLDLLVHVPDLTLAGSPPRLGLGLWYHPAIAMPLEIALTLGTLWLYVRARHPSPARAAVLAALLLAMQAINWFGPVEAEVTLGTSLLALFAYGAATLAAWWLGKSACE